MLHLTNIILILQYLAILLWLLMFGNGLLPTCQIFLKVAPHLLQQSDCNNFEFIHIKIKQCKPTDDDFVTVKYNIM